MTDAEREVEQVYREALYTLAEIASEWVMSHSDTLDDLAIAEPDHTRHLIGAVKGYQAAAMVLDRADMLAGNVQ